jgi:perosamine synthetase
MRVARPVALRESWRRAFDITSLIKFSRRRSKFLAMSSPLPPVYSPGAKCRLDVMTSDSPTPAFPDGPPAWPIPDDDVRAALDAAYADGSWGRYHGPNCQRLRAALAEYHGVEHVTLCCSGTIAVELALRGLKVGPDDEVLLAGYDFAGNFRAIEAVGARPALVDIEPATWCLDVERLEAAIAPETRAVIVSHLHGGLVPMRRLMHIAAARGIAVVEDACQAPGAIIDGRRAGTWGDAGV